MLGAVHVEVCNYIKDISFLEWLYGIPTGRIDVNASFV